MHSRAEIRIRQHSTAGVRVIEVAGEVDISTVASFDAAMDEAFDQDERLITVDLLGVDFMDSSMVHALLRARRRAGMVDAEIAVVCAADTVCRVLTLAAVDKVIEIYPTRDEAIAGFGRHDG